MLLSEFYAYHGKDIGLITGYVLQPGTSHMTMGVSVFPSVQWWNVTIQIHQIEYLGDK